MRGRWSRALVRLPPLESHPARGRFSTVTSGGFTLLVFCLGLLLVSGTRASAEEALRFGLFVGQNEGGRGTSRLLYAESDSRRMRDLFIQVGSLKAENAWLLRATDASQVKRTIEEVGARLRTHRQQGGKAALIFYYSGHADALGLRLGATRLPVQDLKSALAATQADLRIVVLDACSSGTAIQTKGGTMAPAFLVEVDRGAEVMGEVIITSSAADESSQESDGVGGGFFTYHLATGLLGAADRTGDGRVTLEEAYEYAYHRTLLSTASSAAGLQHPSFRSSLMGYGELTLTEIQGGQTLLRFPEGLEGHFLVFDTERKRFIADLELDGSASRQLSLPAGRYLVQQRLPDHLRTSQIHLTRGTTQSVDSTKMVRESFEQDISKGVATRNHRQATTSPLRIGLSVGRQRFVLEPPGATLFPDTPMVSVDLEWFAGLGTRWCLTADTAGSATTELLDFGDYQVSARYLQLEVGVGLRRRIVWEHLELGLGPRLSGLYVGRAFPGIEQAYQDLFTLTPGVLGEITYRLGPRVSLRGVARAHVLLYQAGEESANLLYDELLLGTAIHF